MRHLFSPVIMVGTNKDVSHVIWQFSCFKCERKYSLIDSQSSRIIMELLYLSISPKESHCRSPPISPSLSPWQFHTVSPWIFLFWTFHVTDITKYMSFHGCLCLLSTYLRSMLKMLLNVSVHHLFLWLHNISLYECAVFAHPPICWQVLACVHCLTDNSLLTWILLFSTLFYVFIVSSCLIHFCFPQI